MSAEVMAMLAKRWHCSVADVRERIAAKVKAAGLVPDSATVRPYETGAPYKQKLTLGVTDDDRVAVLDEHDHVLMWLE